ncbi:MAG TPA: hypothetical protein VK752_26075 [Bryobacteraceae bacterium]|jgi:hypothetical protein|nr:hypothetical protein [Bryobacteraceae bacterium]
MFIDPKKALEAGSELIQAVSLAKKAVAMFPAPKPQKTRRKSDWDPLRDKNRRKSAINLRLRTGIWLHFHYKTGHGKFQILETSESEHLMSAFIEEAANYQISDRSASDALVLPSTLALPAADFACAKWMEIPAHQRQAVMLADETANYVLSNFNVRMLDRRHLPPQQSPFPSVGLLLDTARALFHHPKRRKADRDSRQAKDRRQSGVAQRLKIGIWLQFHRKTGYGITEVLQAPEWGNLIHALIAEGDNYEFTDHKSPEMSLMPSMIAAPAADFARALWTELPAKHRQAFILTEEVANYVLTNYNVRMIDRRRTPNHQAATG